MDISVLAAVGSFAVSERVLKPKASVLVILGCVLAYDLTTKTHDVSSLRVYRGPALLAFTLMMSAWSLRTWRRNGVACDELLFLPGTPHGETHGVEGPSVVDTSISSNNNGATDSSHHEGDAAAGLALQQLQATTSDEMEPMLNSQHEQSISSPLSLSPVPEQHQIQSRDLESLEPPPLSTAITSSSSATPVRPRLTSVDDGDDSEDEFIDQDLSNNDDAYHTEDELSDGSEQLCGPAGLFQRTRSMTLEEADSSHHHQRSQQEQQTSNLDRFRESHPRIVRIGTFFFFRSPNTTTQNAAYAPSGPSVFGAALDMSMPILFNFHLFIEAYNHIGQDELSEMTAKILPLIFLSVLIVRTMVPPGRRKRFWSTIRFTVVAPFHQVRFRDAFIGEVLTSMVRPLQDIFFALSYYATVVYGIVAGGYSLTQAAKILEGSWFLHNIVLPSCAMLPLWWRFLQTLRQAHDNAKRWPYLGDAFKHLSAALVILYGMTHPEGRRSAWWIVSFVGAVLYQIWYDTVVDWELFTIAPRADGVASRAAEAWENCCCARISSFRPDSVVLLWIQMKLIQPISDVIRRIILALPDWDQIQLRSKRLYKTNSFYYRCFILNCILRFTWMLCFIPAYRLTSKSGETEKVTTFSSDVHSYIGVLLPVAELVRRVHWGFLKVEMETIRMMDADVAYSSVLEDDTIEDTSKHDRSTLSLVLPTWLDAPHQQQAASNRKCFQCNDSLRHKLFVVELSCWVVAFVGLGYWATY